MRKKVCFFGMFVFKEKVGRSGWGEEVIDICKYFFYFLVLRVELFKFRIFVFIRFYYVFVIEDLSFLE